MRRQLFIDNHALASATGIRRALHRPTKLGAPVLRSPIAGFGLQSRNAPIWNPEKQLCARANWGQCLYRSVVLYTTI